MFKTLKVYPKKVKKNHKNLKQCEKHNGDRVKRTITKSNV